MNTPAAIAQPSESLQDPPRLAEANRVTRAVLKDELQRFMGLIDGLPAGVAGKELVSALADALANQVPPAPTTSASPAAGVNSGEGGDDAESNLQDAKEPINRARKMLEGLCPTLLAALQGAPAYKSKIKMDASAAAAAKRGGTEEGIVQHAKGHQKWLKMLDMGIPKEAVEQKMKIDGVDPENLVDLFDQSELAEPNMDSNSKRHQIEWTTLPAGPHLHGTVWDAPDPCLDPDIAAALEAHFVWTKKA